MLREMKAKCQTAKPGPDKSGDVATPVREADVELTPKAESKVANKLPRAEQLNKFEQDLEETDSGNRPA